MRAVPQPFSDEDRSRADCVLSMPLGRRLLPIFPPSSSGVPLRSLLLRWLSPLPRPCKPSPPPCPLLIERAKVSNGDTVLAFEAITSVSCWCLLVLLPLLVMPMGGFLWLALMKLTSSLSARLVPVSCRHVYQTICYFLICAPKKQSSAYACDKRRHVVRWIMK